MYIDSRSGSDKDIIKIGINDKGQPNDPQSFAFISHRYKMNLILHTLYAVYYSVDADFD